MRGRPAESSAKAPLVTAEATAQHSPTCLLVSVSHHLSDIPRVVAAVPVEAAVAVVAAVSCWSNRRRVVAVFMRSLLSPGIR